MQAWFKALAETDPVLGGLVAVLCGVVVFLFKIWRDDQKASQGVITKMAEQYAAQVERSNATNERLAAAMEERNVITRQLGEATRLQAEATAAQSKVIELQSQRLVDRFAGQDMMSSALSGAIRTLDEKVTDLIKGR